MGAIRRWSQEVKEEGEEKRWRSGFKTKIFVNQSRRRREKWDSK